MAHTLRNTLNRSYGSNEDDTIHLGDDLTMSFRRTVRVPDNIKASLLPPDLGAFPLYRVSQYDKLPETMKAKGGLFFPMYKREAMWIRFQSLDQYAIKVYVGGVNATSGEPAVENFATKLRRQKLVSEGKTIQDYVVTPNQSWLDGIAVTPGQVRQFVAVGSGSGFSVEAQITGEEAVGGIQVEVTPQKPTAGTPNMPIYVKNLTGPVTTLQVYPAMRISEAQQLFTDVEGLPRILQRWIFGGKQLEGSRTLRDYDIQKGETIHLLVRLSGGGSGRKEIKHGMEIAAGGFIKHEMRIAAGGLIKQTIVQDPHDPMSWDRNGTVTFNVQILNSEMFQQVTSKRPPPSPISASTYSELGLPFYDLYEEPSFIHGEFDQVKSLTQISGTHDPHQTFVSFELNPSGPKREFSPFDELLEKAKALKVARFD